MTVCHFKIQQNLKILFALAKIRKMGNQFYRLLAAAAGANGALTPLFSTAGETILCRGRCRRGKSLPESKRRIHNQFAKLSCGNIGFQVVNL